MINGKWRVGEAAAAVRLGRWLAGAGRLATALAVGLAVAPWVLAAPSDTWIGLGVVSALVALMLVPYWAVPVGLWPSRTAALVGDTLRVPSLRGPRRIRLSELRRFRAGTFLGGEARAILVLAADDDARVVLMFTEQVEPDWLRARLIDLAAGDAVRTSPGTRSALALPDEPPRDVARRRWMRGAALSLLFLGPMCLVAFLYVLALVDRTTP